MKKKLSIVAFVLFVSATLNVNASENMGDPTECHAYACSVVDQYEQLAPAATQEEVEWVYSSAYMDCLFN